MKMATQVDDPEAGKVGVMRKKVIMNKYPDLAEDLTVAPTAVAAPPPLLQIRIKTDDALFATVDISSLPETGYSMQDGAFKSLYAAEPVTDVGGGQGASKLWVPDGDEMVQVEGTPGDDAWAWSNLNDFKALSDDGKIFFPRGAWAKQITDGKTIGMFTYNVDDRPKAIKQVKGRPIDAWLCFLVPKGVEIKTIYYKGIPYSE
jgi:formylmethanofuran dehydrogenase subunit D